MMNSCFISRLPKPNLKLLLCYSSKEGKYRKHFVLLNVSSLYNGGKYF